MIKKLFSPLILICFITNGLPAFSISNPFLAPPGFTNDSNIEITPPENIFRENNEFRNLIQTIHDLTGKPEIECIQIFNKLINRRHSLTQKKLINIITQLPELKGKITAQDLKKLIIENNEGGFYRKQKKSPPSIMIKGELASYMGFSDEDMPLYYTITASGNIGEDIDRYLLREATDLAKDMRYKNILAEVLFDGGKTILYVNGNNYVAITCVYADKKLYDSNDVIAKGGVRLYAQNSDITDVLKAYIGYIFSFIDLGTLGVSRIEGPDMFPLGDVQIMMEIIDLISQIAARDSGKKLLPVTTGGRPEKGYLSHNELRATSLSVLESLCALLEDKKVMKKFKINTKKPITIILQGFGEVASNIIRLIKEKNCYKKYNFVIAGISDYSGAYYNSNGFDLNFLYELTNQRENLMEMHPGKQILLEDLDIGTVAHAQLKNRDDLIFQKAVIGIPAGPPYVIQDKNDASKLKIKILAPAGNAVLGKRDSSKKDIRNLEIYLLKIMKIINAPSWLINFGGMASSKEEILHRLSDGGLDQMLKRKDFLREHVTTSHIEDIAWVNTWWALYLWKKSKYKKPISEIMQNIATQALQIRRTILLNWPQNTLSVSLSDRLLRLDLATKRAKIETLTTSIGEDALKVLTNSLTDTDQPEHLRRVAAMVLGKSARQDCLEPLLKIIENENESPVMFRNAVLGLSYILEGRAERFGDVIMRLIKVNNLINLQLQDIHPGTPIYQKWVCLGYFFNRMTTSPIIGNPNAIKTRDKPTDVLTSK